MTFVNMTDDQHNRLLRLEGYISHEGMHTPAIMKIGDDLTGMWWSHGYRPLLDPPIVSITDPDGDVDKLLDHMWITAGGW